MFSIKKIVFCLILILNFSVAQSAEKIVYLDIDQVLNKTNVGKKIIKNLDSLRKNNLQNIKKQRDDLKKKETNYKNKKTFCLKKSLKCKLFL